MPEPAGFLKAGGDGRPAAHLQKRAVGQTAAGNERIREVKSSIFKAFSMGNNGTAEPPARDDEEEEDDGEDNENGKNAAAGKE